MTSFSGRDGEVPSQKELSSYFEELFSSKVPCQKELSSSNEELFPNPALLSPLGCFMLSDFLKMADVSAVLAFIPAWSQLYKN